MGLGTGGRMRKESKLVSRLVPINKYTQIVKEIMIKIKRSGTINTKWLKGGFL